MIIKRENVKKCGYCGIVSSTLNKFCPSCGQPYRMGAELHA